MTLHRWWPFIITAVVVVLDRITKFLVEREIAFWERIQVIPGFFQIVHTRNTGIAFGFFQSDTGESSGLLILFTVLVMGFLAAVLWNAGKDGGKEHWTLRAALGLILGGAIGNLYDRAILGSVTDFLDFYAGANHFPVFNVADSAITVGASLLVINLWIGSRRKP
jgi:signal peptidase II